MKVGILGCGPSGLIAAHTADALGHDVTVFSQSDIPSYIAGAQYLHAPVPGLHNSEQPDTYIRITKTGSKQGYARKVYGRDDAPVSWELYDRETYPAWNMRDAYKRLCDVWLPRVVPVTLNARKVAQAASQGVLEGRGLQALVSTVPLKAICGMPKPDPMMGIYNQHAFISQKVYIVQYEDRHNGDPSFIVYNGEKAPAWYRRSVIFGTEALEWSSAGPKPPIDELTTIRKPLATNCDCHASTNIPVLLHGRYGAWRKNVLVHDVARDVMRWLGGLS